MPILAIDQGTSGTKALVVGDRGEVLSRGFGEVAIHHGPGGLVECDPGELWGSLVSAVSQATSTSPSLEAVGLANQGESILAWDPRTLEPLSPVIVWQDSRAASLCDDRRDHEEFVRARTGLQLDPYFVAPKMKWLRENMTREGVVTTTDAWLHAKLTGHFVTDIATASRTLLLDIHTGAWSHELLELWGLANETLPEVVACDQIIGAITTADLPSLRGVQVSGAIVDQPAALFAQSCVIAGEAKCTYGTGAFLLANIGATPKISQFGLATSIAWELRGERAHYLDGQVFTAASAVAWLIENGLLESAEAIDSLPRDSGGVMAISALAGFGAPRWKPSGSGAIAGISLASTKDHIARAVVDGIAAQVTELIAAMNADGVALQRLRVDGGLTRSKTLMQMQADLAQIPVDVYPHPDATALGVAAITRLGAEPTLSIDEAITPWRPVATYEPEWSADQAAEYMSTWKDLADNAQERSAHG